MYIPFQELPASSRVWIYQSNRDFTEAEELKITEWLGAFVQGWQAHGADLQASYQIKYSRFIIIGANEEFHAPSGCSIDSSVAIIRQIEQQLNVSLLDRSQVAYKSSEGTIKTVGLPQLKTAIVDEMEILPETKVFNNMITTLNELNTKWEVPAQDTWILKYFPVHML